MPRSAMKGMLMLIQYIKREKHAVEEVRVVDAIRKCDICGREITGPHFELLSFHSGWWNDPIDSTRIMDCCDSSCLRKVIDMYLIGIETNPGTNLRISYKMEAISSRDLSKIDKDAEQRYAERKL